MTIRCDVASSKWVTLKKQVEVLTKKNQELMAENKKLRSTLHYHEFPYIIPILRPKHNFPTLNDPLEGFCAGAFADVEYD